VDAVVDEDSEEDVAESADEAEKKYFENCKLKVSAQL